MGRLRLPPSYIGAAKFPRLWRANFAIVHRTSYFVHGQPPSASAVSRSFVTTPVHGLTTSRSHVLRIPAQRARIRKSYIVPRTSYMGSPRLPPIPSHQLCIPAQRARTSQVDSPAPPCHGCFGVAPRLLLRSRLTTVASESPHDCCFGVAPRLLTPAGQKLRFWPNWLTAVASFRPCGAAHPRCPYALTVR